MVLALGEEQHLAEGTSLLVILPTAVTGVLAHRRRGYVSFHTGMLLALGGSAGAWVGAISSRCACPLTPSRWRSASFWQ